MTKLTKQKSLHQPTNPAFRFSRLLAAVLSFSSRVKVKSKLKPFLNIFLKGKFSFLFNSNSNKKNKSIAKSPKQSNQSLLLPPQQFPKKDSLSTRPNAPRFFPFFGSGRLKNQQPPSRQLFAVCILLAIKTICHEM